MKRKFRGFFSGDNYNLKFFERLLSELLRMWLTQHPDALYLSVATASKHLGAALWER